MRFNPCVCFFKPRGIPLTLLEEEVLEADELEAIKLYNIDNLDQLQASKKMEISQPTFARILNSAYKKISRAIIYGKAIRIEKK